MADTHSATAPDYFVPAPSTWPMVGMIAMVLAGFGAAMLVNKVPFGGWVLLAGFAVLAYMMFGWFGAVIAESESGKYRHKEDVSFRWAMGWLMEKAPLTHSAKHSATTHGAAGSTCLSQSCSSLTSRPTRS